MNNAKENFQNWKDITNAWNEIHPAEYRGWNFLKIPLNRFPLNSIFVRILGGRGERRDSRLSPGNYFGNARWTLLYLRANPLKLIVAARLLFSIFSNWTRLRKISHEPDDDAPSRIHRSTAPVQILNASRPRWGGSVSSVPGYFKRGRIISNGSASFVAFVVFESLKKKIHFKLDAYKKLMLFFAISNESDFNVE